MPTAAAGAAGAARPPRRRAAALRLRGGHAAAAAALDVGPASSSREVFLTHYHADHYLGLPGMLKTFALRGRELPLTVYGPPGLARPLRRAAADLRPAHLPARARRARSPATRSSAATTGSTRSPSTHGVSGARLRARRGRRGPAASTSRPPTRSACRRARSAARSSAASRSRSPTARVVTPDAGARPGARRAARSCITGDTAPVDAVRRGRARAPTCSSTRRPSARTSASARARRCTRPPPRRPRSPRDAGGRAARADAPLDRATSAPRSRARRATSSPRRSCRRDFDVIDVPFRGARRAALVKGGALDSREARAAATPCAGGRRDDRAWCRSRSPATSTEAEELQAILREAGIDVGARERGRAPSARATTRR